MVCYWSISARLPYTFLLPFVLRPATFVHTEDVGWYTRDREEGERWESTAQSHTGIPRTPRIAWIPETLGEKTPLLLFFVFLSRISRKVSAREKARRAAVKYFVVTELDTERRTLFFHDWSLIFFINKYYYHIPIFSVILRKRWLLKLVIFTHYNFNETITSK